MGLGFARGSRALRNQTVEPSSNEIVIRGWSLSRKLKRGGTVHALIVVFANVPGNQFHTDFAVRGACGSRVVQPVQPTPAPVVPIDSCSISCSS